MTNTCTRKVKNKWSCTLSALVHALAQARSRYLLMIAPDVMVGLDAEGLVWKSYHFPKFHPVTYNYSFVSLHHCHAFICHGSLIFEQNFVLNYIVSDLSPNLETFIKFLRSLFSPEMETRQ